MRTLLVFIALVASLALGDQASATCPPGVNPSALCNQPAAVDLQPSDLVQVFQFGQTPGTRAATTSQVGAVSNPDADITGGTISNTTITGGTITGANVSGSDVTATGSTTALPLATSMSDFKDARSYGLTGSGDEGVKLNAVLAAMTSGGKLMIPMDLTITVNSVVTIPAGVTLFTNRAIGSINRDNSNYTVPSGGLIRLGTSGQIQCAGGGGCMDGLVILPLGMTFPQQSAAGFPNQTAVIATGDDTTVKNTQIVGFATCISASSVQRLRVQNVQLDCNKYVDLSGSLDVSVIEQAHGWPYATVGAPTLTTTLGAAVTVATVSSGTYDNATGNVILTTAASHGIGVGDTFQLNSVTGTGDVTILNGTWVATAGTTGSTLKFTAESGGTITVTGGTAANLTATVTVASNAGFPTSGQFVVMINNENFLVTAGPPATAWTATRGYYATPVAPHSNGATVTIDFNARTDNGFKIHDTSDGTQFIGSFSFSHPTGLLLSGALSGVTVRDFRTEGGSYGVLADAGAGSIQQLLIDNVNCQSAGTCVSIGLGAGGNAKVNNVTAINPRVSGLTALAGTVFINDFWCEDLTPNNFTVPLCFWPSGAIVYLHNFAAIGSNIVQVGRAITVNHNSYLSITGAIALFNVAGPQMAVDPPAKGFVTNKAEISSDASAGDLVFANTAPITVASASNLLLPPSDYPMIKVTGNTTVVNMASPWVGRQVLLQAETGFTMTNGNGTDANSFVFANGLDRTLSAKEFITMCTSHSGTLWVECSSAQTIKPYLSGTTGTITPGALGAGACGSGTATVTGARSGMGVVATPTVSPLVDDTHGVSVLGYVSANDTVTVKVCAIVATTPAPTTYNARVIQ